MITKELASVWITSDGKKFLSKKESEMTESSITTTLKVTEEIDKTYQTPIIEVGVSGVTTNSDLYIICSNKLWIIVGFDTSSYTDWKPINTFFSKVDEAIFIPTDEQIEEGLNYQAQADYEAIIKANKSADKGKISSNYGNTIVRNPKSGKILKNH